MLNTSTRTYGRAVIATQALVTLLLVCLVVGQAAAAPIVDGRFDPTEGYTLGRWVEFDVENSSTIATDGQLWTYQDPVSGDVFVNFFQPKALVDNTYGDNTVGWGKVVAPSGKNHNFEDLKGSDKAQFVFTDGLGNIVLDVTMDYITQSASAPSGYDCLGVTGGDGGVDTGSASDVLEWGSTLDYNFNTLGFALTENSPATDDSYTENPDFVGWLFEVGYELRISGDVFGESGFGDVRIPIVHDSPNKIGKNKVWPRVDVEVPEPATLGLLMFAAAGMLLRRRRRVVRSARSDG